MVKIILFSSLFIQMHAQDFLDQRVLDYGHFTPFYEFGSPVDAMVEIIEIMRYSISHRFLTIAFDQNSHRTRIPYLRFDRRRLQQVLMNLLSNACKSQLTGIIYVNARVIVEEYGSDAALIEISVEDKGVGIASNDLEEIFKPFRMQNSKGVKGNGVGLSISRQICQQMHGTIEVQSKLGVGSVFTFTMRAFING